MSATTDQVTALAAMRAMLEKEREKYQRLLRKTTALANDLTDGTTNLGRNAIKRSEMDSYKKVNLDSITTFLKWTLIPNVKFQHQNWWHYKPNERRSLFRRISSEVDWPEDCHFQHYWLNHIVPLINKKFIDYRSNATTAMREQGLSEL